MRIEQGGNVGIGTTEPQSYAGVNRMLHLANSTHVGIVLEDSSAGGSAEMWVDNGTFKIWGQTNSNYYFVGQESTGFTGIGTNAPNRLFHVYSGSAGTDPTWASDDAVIIESSLGPVVQLFSPTTGYG